MGGGLGGIQYSPERYGCSDDVNHILGLVMILLAFSSVQQVNLVATCMFYARPSIQWWEELACSDLPT